ncbi:MAG: ornithine carbamoyltransferase [Candidatus Pacebacteria bacterium]|nr:ornithine carbamoyltransferase [Candidatus Paceibacterota bacterium]
MKHLISLKENSNKDLLEILALAQKLKKLRNQGKIIDVLKNKTLIMLFQKSSTRTRLSFEAAMTELGGHAIFLDSRTTQFSLTDFKDEIKAVMRYGSILMFRALKASDVELAAQQNQIPVIDACSEKYHPCQALGDILTMSEKAGGLNKIKKIAWLGVENNVSNTLKLTAAKLGIKVSIIAPEVNPDSIDSELNKLADKTGNISYTNDIKTGLKNVNFVHTDTWMDMEFFDGGKIKKEFTKEYNRRKKLLSPYQLNAKLVDNYCHQAKIMHCMPCHIGYEISRDAIDHQNSIIFDQAENRMHIQKAIILWLLDIKI